MGGDTGWGDTPGGSLRAHLEAYARIPRAHVLMPSFIKLIWATHLLCSETPGSVRRPPREAALRLSSEAAGDGQAAGMAPESAGQPSSPWEMGPRFWRSSLPQFRCVRKEGGLGIKSKITRRAAIEPH